MFIKKSSDEGYDLPEARRIADYQLTIKTELQEKVGRNRVAGILDFDISNPAQLKKRLPKLKNQTGMYFFDPFDGKIKLLTNKNGILGFDDFNSIEEITFAAPDVGSATTKEISSNPSYMRETNPDVITPSIKKFLQNVEENQTPTFDIADQKQMKDRLPTLKNKVGMYFFDPYDGQIKLLTNKNGVLGFESFNSVGEINFAEPDVGSATIELEPQQDIFSPEIDDASP